MFGSVSEQVIFHLASGREVERLLYVVCAGGIWVLCWRPQSPWLAPCVLLSLQSPRLSQQSLQMDWRTCGQTWPPSLFCSHGTESRPGEFPGNAFFQLMCSVFNFWLNPLSGFPPVFLFSFFFSCVGWFCFHGIGLTLLEMPGAFGICWNHLRPFLFSAHVGAAPSVSVGRLIDLWFVFCAMHYIFFLYVNQPRQARTFICVNAAPRQHTELWKYKEHVSIWKPLLSFFFLNVCVLALEMALLVCPPLQSSKTDVFQQILDGLPWNSLQMFTVPLGWMLMSSVFFRLFLSLAILSIWGFEWNVLTAIGLV